jgi:tetratricopeptide (TPR) repeat protein
MEVPVISMHARRAATTASSRIRRVAHVVVATLVPMLLVAACAGPSSRPGAARFDVDRELGFSITENVRIGADVRADYDAALRHFEAERYGAGIALLQRVAARAPDVTATHIDLGIAYHLSGDLERAEESLKRALELSPRHPVAHNELGLVYRKTGRFTDARASYERALQVHPLFHYARRNLAILCDVYLADLACAIEHYEAYYQAVPNDEEAAMWIADLRNRVSR